MACAACTKRGQTWQGDRPRCAFKTKAFGENWNCATVNSIRDLVYEGQPAVEGVDYRYCEDMKYATVKIDEIELEKGHALALWVAWYKSRGGTDAMWILDSDQPPRPPTEDDLLRILAHYTRFELTDAGREVLK